MVNSATTFGRSGVHDFILLRSTAIILASYALFMAYFFITTPQVTFEVWTAFFAHKGVKIFTSLAIIAVMIHAWIGIWQVLTDYIKCSKLRGGLQFLFSVALVSYFVTGFMTVWGV
jgi:succinate dehydrogenase / fumarate reductase membrane anchor subunit